MPQQCGSPYLEYTYDDGPNGGGQRVEPGLSGFTSDRAARDMYTSEVERHVRLRLAELQGQPVPDHPAAYLVELYGCSEKPKHQRTNIYAEALTQHTTLPSDVIAYQVHSIRTYQGRLIREKGTGKAVNRVQARAMLSLTPDDREDDPNAPWAGTFAPGILPTTQGPISHWPRRTA